MKGGLFSKTHKVCYFLSCVLSTMWRVELKCISCGLCLIKGFGVNGYITRVVTEFFELVMEDFIKP
jgi:hypothetical protein